MKAARSGRLIMFAVARNEESERAAQKTHAPLWFLAEPLVMYRRPGLPLRGVIPITLISTARAECRAAGPAFGALVTSSGLSLMTSHTVPAVVN